MLDEVGKALSSFEPGRVGEIQAHGEIWTATANVPIQAGDPVRVVAVNGLVLTVDPEPATNGATQRP
jgi:membrane-bound serine protease (ClpP class)